MSYPFMEPVNIDRYIACIACEEQIKVNSKAIEFTSGRTICLGCAAELSTIMDREGIKDENNTNDLLP